MTKWTPPGKNYYTYSSTSPRVERRILENQCPECGRTLVYIPEDPGHISGPPDHWVSPEPSALYCPNCAWEAEDYEVEGYEAFHNYSPTDPIDPEDFNQ